MTEALRDRFGKYHVLEKIAQGGMAEVYKVKTVGIAGFEKIQALKRILPSSAREGRFIRSFIDEARIAVELTHRNIVQVFDFGKADGELFLAMELIEGKDLKTALGEAVARDAMPSVPVAAYIISEVAAGLDYAHRKTDGYGGSLGIVHCDVSPSNVMLSTDGYVKILDFGIARASFASALERRRLRGKPRYMAPEQTLGEPPTSAADVFALGIIAWELFTGLPLYKGPDLKSILESVRRTTPPRIDTINGAVPKEIVDAIATALSREPQQRGTAADLGAACTRTAMQTSPRLLAAWLAEIGEQPALVPVWQADPTSVSVSQRPKAERESRISTATLSPPTRPSITASLANVPTPRGDLGEGTPGFTIDIPTRIGDEGPRRPSSTARLAPGDFFDREPSTVPAGLRDSTTALGRPLDFDDVPARASGRWSIHDPVAPEPAPTEPSVRPSFATIDAGPDAWPSFDDGATFHGAATVVEQPGYDELEVEASLDEAPVTEVPRDDAIDDDLGALATGLPAERRRTVVVACALAGAAAEVLRPIAKSLGELAYQRGGVVLSQADDALVVAFGLEVAGEDDIAIAMGWALDGVAMVRDLRTSTTALDHLALRIGGRTGVSTAGGDTLEAGGGTRVPQDAIDEARALAREATPDRPLFVGGTGRVSSGLYTLKEVATPRRLARRGSGKAIEVVGPRGFDERDRARLERRGKFVGRTAQLAELDDWFQRAIASNRRFAVLVTGAAGTGKSRLVAELIARRQNAGTPLRVVTTAASPASHLAPFALVIDLYQAALGLPPSRGRGARAQVVQRLFHVMTKAGVTAERAKTVATDLDRAMELRDGVGIGAPEVADLRPRVSAGLAAFRAALVDRQRPLLTLIEDIQLADSASLEVLRHTLAVPAAAPELLILTARPDELTPPAVDATIAIGDLVGAELRALIADRLGDQSTPFNIAAVLARGGGNPLFVEELAQAVRDAGDGGDDVPQSARDVVTARVERASTKARAVLRFAAVLGGAIRTRLIEELLGEETVEPELEELVAAGMLVRSTGARPDGGSWSDGELQFARGLVREVVYDSLSARARRESHQRVGRLLASRFFAGREEPPAVVAEHLERGGELAGAAAFWLRAGRLALTASDATAAVAHFSRTLMLERELGAAPPSPTSRVRRREAYAGREEGHRLLGDLQADASDLDELQRLSEGDSGRLANVAIRRAQRMLRLGDFANASIATVVAADHATAAGDDRLRGEALRVRGEILERLGRFDEALDMINASRELFHRQRAVSDEMAAMIGRGRIHLLRAHYEAARDAYRPVLALIEKTKDPWLERIVTNHVAVIDMCLGKFSRAMASVQRSLELCRRYGDRAREGDGLSVAGIIYLEVGLHDRAAATFAEALELLARTSSRWSRADCLIYAGVCDVRRGRPDGMQLLGEALAEARQIGARYLEANALVARAGAQLRLGRLEAAVDDASTGITVAHQATLVGYEIQGLARKALALSRLGGRTAEASSLVHRALGLLDRQVYLEGSEEEILVACAEVLKASGGSEPTALLERARASARRKHAALTDPAWRAAYAELPEIRGLLA